MAHAKMAEEERKREKQQEKQALREQQAKQQQQQQQQQLAMQRAEEQRRKLEQQMRQQQREQQVAAQKEARRVEEERRKKEQQLKQQQAAGKRSASVDPNRRGGDAVGANSSSGGSSSGGGDGRPAGKGTRGPSLGEQLRRQPIAAAYLVGAAAASAGAWLSEATGSQDGRERGGEGGEGGKGEGSSKPAGAASMRKGNRGGELGGVGGEEGGVADDAVRALQSMLAAISAALNTESSGSSSSTSSAGSATSEEEVGEWKEQGKGEERASKAPQTAASTAGQQPVVRGSAAEPATAVADETGREPGAVPASGLDTLLGQQLASLKAAWSDIVSAAFTARGGGAGAETGAGGSEEGEQGGGAGNAQQLDGVVPPSYLSKDSRLAVQALLDRHSSLRRYAEQQGTLEMKDAATARSADPAPAGGASKVVTVQLQELQQLRAQRAASAAGLLQVVAELDGQMSALEESIRDGRDFAAEQQEMLARVSGWVGG